MKRSSRPLWKLLIIFSEPEPTDELTCDECFNVLQYLADEADKGLEEKYLKEAVQRHLDHCPDCWEHHVSMLGEIEEKIYSRK